MKSSPRNPVVDSYDQSQSSERNLQSTNPMFPSPAPNLSIGTLQLPPQAGDDLPETDQSEVDNLSAKINRTKRLMMVTIGVVAVVAIGAALLFTVGSSSGGNDGSSSQASNSGDGLSVPLTPTKYPTILGTLRPTFTPTAFPTKSPSGQTTARPSFSPTTSPTKAPVAACSDPDAQCGCDLVQSEKVDVIFLADESGSVGADNYDLLTQAVRNFARQVEPPYDPEEGSRVGYIEFSTAVNFVIDLSQFSTAEEFANNVDDDHEGGFTNHRLAFLAVEEMLAEPENALREGAQLAIVMITDGNPCVGCGSSCCADSIEQAGGADVLRRLRDNFDFTFFFLPIDPPGNNNGIDLTVFDDAIGPQGASQGLSEEEFVRFEPQAFSALNEFLSGDEFVFPLGPCIEPPTFSEGDRELLRLDVESSILSPTEAEIETETEAEAKMHSSMLF